MDRHERKIEELLGAAGARIVRRRKHVVYRLLSGRSFVQPKTGSDWRGSRNALSDLGQLLRAGDSNTMPEVEPGREVAAVPRRRRRQGANRDARSYSEAVIPKLGRIERKDQDRFEMQFLSLDDVLEQAEDNDAFWELDACGRCRVLSKFIAPFARVEPVSTQFFPLQVEEWEELNDPIRDDHDQRIGEFIQRMGEHWKWNWSMGLLVRDDYDYGDVLLEPMALSMLGGVDAILVNPIDVSEATPVSFGVWDLGDFTRDEDVQDQSVFCVWVLPETMKEYRHYYEACDCWTDPAKTRKVVRLIMEQYVAYMGSLSGWDENLSDNRPA
jgi:hypothetical protein